MSNRNSMTQQLCLNAMHELAQTKVIDRISVQDVLDRTGISKATFYRHFHDRYDLFEKMLRRDVAEIYSDTCQLELWPDRICALLRQVEREEIIFSRMIRVDPTSFTTFYTNVLLGLFRKRLERVFGKDYPASAALQRRCVCLSAGMAAVMANWVAQGCAESPEVLGAEFTDMMVSAFRGTELDHTAV